MMCSDGNAEGVKDAPGRMWTLSYQSVLIGRICCHLCWFYVMDVTGNGNICRVPGTTVQGWRGQCENQFFNTPANPTGTLVGQLRFTLYRPTSLFEEWKPLSTVIGLKGCEHLLSGPEVTALGRVMLCRLLCIFLLWESTGCANWRRMWSCGCGGGAGNPARYLQYQRALECLPCVSREGKEELRHCSFWADHLSPSLWGEMAMGRPYTTSPASQTCVPEKQLESSWSYSWAPSPDLALTVRWSCSILPPTFELSFAHLWGIMPQGSGSWQGVGLHLFSIQRKWRSVGGPSAEGEHICVPRGAASLLPAPGPAKRKSFQSLPDVTAPFPTIYEIKNISCVKLKRFKEDGFHSQLF